MSLVYETVISRLGSRFSINFRPKQNSIRISPMGRFFDEEVELCLGVRLENQTRILPFSREYDCFPFIEQELTPTSIKFHCSDPELGLYALFEFVSPFCPREEVLCTAPFFYVKSWVEYRGGTKMEGDAFLNRKTDAPIEGEILLLLKGNALKTECTGEDGVVFSMNSSIDPDLARQKWMDKTRGKEFSSASYPGKVAVYGQGAGCENGVRIPFSVHKFQPVEAMSILAAYTGAYVFNISDELYRFRYTGDFAGLDDVIRYALEHKAVLLDKTAFFETTVLEACGGQDMTSLFSLALQSYLCNSWWVVNDQGKDWYTAWEGNCAYHSTIDVEYNIAPFYLLFWPELLEKLLDQWKDYERPEGYMPHDIGKFLVGKGMEYSHDMEVEETCNYMLLVYALYKFTGKKDLLDGYYKQLARLAAYVKNSDTTGNGFPNTGTATTFDDACPAVQYSKEQTYLAIKAYAALTAMEELAEGQKDAALAAMCAAQKEKIKETLGQRSWQGDHYAVCIDKTADGIVDVWTGETMSGEMEGWDAYSIYCTNGLLYLLMTGTAISLDRDQLTQDVVNATEHSMTRYACKHSSSDNTNNFWISQNLWKDMTAAYLGVDMTDLVEKYWAFELSYNLQGFRGCFVDSSTLAGLYCYPRGITASGMFYAAGGVSLDAEKKIIKFAPVKVPCRVFLFSLADWKKQVVPVVSFRIENGGLIARVEGRECLKGFRLLLNGEEI